MALARRHWHTCKKAQIISKTQVPTVHWTSSTDPALAWHYYLHTQPDNGILLTDPCQYPKETRNSSKSIGPFWSSGECLFENNYSICGCQDKIGCHGVLQKCLKDKTISCSFSSTNNERTINFKIHHHIDDEDCLYVKHNKNLKAP